jgi:hypothetical protein
MYSPEHFYRLAREKAIDRTKYRQCDACKCFMFVKVHRAHQTSCRKKARLLREKLDRIFKTTTTNKEN